MNTRNLKFHLTYAFLFICIFFIGFNNVEIFSKNFPHLKGITLPGVIQFLCISFGGLGLGLILHKRLLYIQPTTTILNFSLISSALLSWLQYHAPNILDIESLSISTIIVFITNIVMGIFIGCARTLLIVKNNNNKNLTTTLLWIFFILGLLALSYRLPILHQDSIYILCSLSYILAFIFSKILKGNEFMEIKNANPYANIGILIGIFYLFILYLFIQSSKMEQLRDIFSHNEVIIAFFCLFFIFKPSFSKAILILFFILVFLNT